MVTLNINLPFGSFARQFSSIQACLALPHKMKALKQRKESLLKYEEKSMIVLTPTFETVLVITLLNIGYRHQRLDK